MELGNAQGSVPARRQTAAGTETGSGIDWGIFDDGEDDAFGWLLRSTLPSDPTATDASADDSTQGLETLATRENEPSSTAAGIPGSWREGRTAAPSAPATAAQICSGLRQVRQEESGGDSDADEDSPAVALAQEAPRKARKHAADADRKLQRREKNLESVRKFRKRKMQQEEQNEARLGRLEAENLDLKMRLKIGKEALVTEQREKQHIKEQMRELLARGAAEHEIAQFLNMYKVTYSDYGPKRQEKLRFHLNSIRELLLPTQVTKLCLYSVEQGVHMLARDSVIREDPSAVPDAAATTMSLWSILAEELGVSEEQQQQILQRREAIRKIRDDLEHSLALVNRLQEVTESKNTALEAQVAELQRILTPSQATKFIIWVKENPAFMYMLDKLVDSTLVETEA